MGPTNALLQGIKDGISGPGPDTGFEGEVSATIAGGDAQPDEFEPDDPLDGAKQVRNSSWFMSQLDSAGFLGGGDCPSDTSISLGGTSIAISLGPICGLLSAISGLVMALAYLQAFKLMARAS
jgi:hypothetical protein